MSTMPINSSWGGPEPRDGQPDVPMADLSDRRPNHASESEQADAPDQDVEWVNTELSTIADTIAQLQGRLEEANTKLASAAKVETTEFEVGRLFVEAQRFTDASLSELDRKVNEILCQADAKAREILAEATQEAHEIRRQAQEAAIASTRTTSELQAAITGFTAVNNELLKELGTLNEMLTPASERGISEIEPSSSSDND
jgi:cell division septum initiation protein DivIVA